MGSSNQKGIKLIGSEYDIQVTSPHTIVQGLGIMGTSVSQPANADGITVDHLDVNRPGKIKWTHSFVTTDGSTNIAFLAGAAEATGANVNGTPNYLNYIDSTGTVRAVRYRSLSDGSFFIDGAAAPSGVKLTTAAVGQYPTVQAEGTDANIGLVLAGKGTAPVIARSRLDARSSLYVAGPAKFESVMQLRAYTVAALPICTAAIQDGMAVVVDAAAPTYRAALTGGGKVRTPVYCDGSNWTAH